MLYAEFINKAKELTINQLDNEVWYLEPEWQDILFREGLGNLDELEDSYLDGWFTLEDILKLEAERRNKRDSRKEAVVNWLYDLITTTVEPAMLAEETDYIKNVVEFMKTNHEIKDNQEENDNVR